MRRPLVLVCPPGVNGWVIASEVAAHTGAEAEEFRCRASDGWPDPTEAREALLERVARGPGVLAVEDFVLAQREARVAVADASVVIWLDPAEPPAGRLGDRAELLQGARGEAHARVTVGAGSREGAIEAILAEWRGDALLVAAGERSYRVEVGVGIMADRLPVLVRRAPATLLVTDENVAQHHGETARAALQGDGTRLLEYVLVPGERSKVMRTVVQVWNVAQAGALDRGGVVVALGGGVVSDAAGFAAASWMRGVRWVVVPTTLLAMVDASVGGKTGVDLRQAKNAVGAFWQPAGVVCDMALLTTEPERGFRSALAEVVKTALLGDAELFGRLEARVDAIRSRDAAALQDIVRASIRVKARIVSLDEREGGVRALLNLGHTLGHALEVLGGFEQLTHGEAVSLGLVGALRIGESLGLTPAGLREQAVALLQRFGLPVELGGYDLAAAADLVAHDKKRAGSALRFVVARAAGKAETVTLELTRVRDLIRACGN